MPTGLLSDRLARIEHHLQEKYIDTGRLAGALTLVSRGGEIGLQSCLGEMDVERDKPVWDDTIFRVLSMSKSVTSVALMMLYEEGLFQLSDPVSRFIPSDDEAVLNVVCAGTSKWPSILKLTEPAGIPAKSVVTYGDDDPDLDMLKAAGIGIAMDNANTRAKDVSDLVAPTNEADRVARVLELILASR